SKCKLPKPLTEFHKCCSSYDGLQKYCKECKSNVNIEYMKTEVGKEVKSKSDKKYKKSELGKKSIDKDRKRYRQIYPNKYKAHMIVGTALRNGTLIRKSCEISSCTGKAEAHHDDYSKPLDVRWLCRKDHRQWHKENGEGDNA